MSKLIFERDGSIVKTSDEGACWAVGRINFEDVNPNTYELNFPDLLQWTNGCRGEDGLLYKSEYCRAWWDIYGDKVPEENKRVYLQALLKEVLLEPQVNTPPAERTTFIKALEDAFWEANGPALLVGLAESNPLEFLKICAKLIDPSAKAPGAGLSISFNIEKPEKVVGSIEPEK